MVDKVVSLADKRLEKEPHVCGTAFCMLCLHRWQGVWPIGVTELECPKCHAMRGRGCFDIAPPPGRKIWTCVNCDNQLFNLLPDRVHCPGCGKAWGYGELV